ncbi:MAG: bifunctional UDP-4-keto-pentose/UDP-xylose synthase [Gammaproteobacteria bacterium]|nr:bifunctional UDP-4-keto-pentose/UDP-xylose synthase [Gammaproteobacteria bacterium]MCW5582292.1 bifunctional UDP-4-keto-pentose/UDP-xylose synthase [Gammaproteobacteria bacterium]
MHILILGANGFIGSHLSDAILAATDWQIYAMDLAQDKLAACLSHARFHFALGDMTKQKDWIDQHIKKCDVILPLAAVATPALYVQDPLRVFELDFEANLDIVRLCAKHKKRVIFPSTSEVYGMCPDMEFDEEKSHLVTGPISKERWIYSTSKQLMDRIIYAMGKHNGLSYSLFRPFNWYGPRLDNVFNPKPGGSRVLTQFIGNILRGENINLVGGGAQQRCFTYVSDGIDAMMRIIENKDDCAQNKIFNIGNPIENISIRQLAETLVHFITQYYPKYSDQAKAVKLTDVDGKSYFGEGYQDISLRVPSIQRARESLGWAPQVNIATGLRKTLDFYLEPGTVCEPVQRESA